jgi:hypothetical protein
MASGRGWLGTAAERARCAAGAQTRSWADAAASAAAAQLGVVGGRPHARRALQSCAGLDASTEQQE